MRNKGIIFMVAILSIIVVTGGCSTAGKIKQDPQAASTTVITGIAIADNSLEIKASRPFVYTIYKPSDPYRIVVDMPDVDVGQFTDKIISKHAGITEVAPSQAASPKGTAKIEVLLQNPSEVEPFYRDNVLTLRIKEGADSKPDLTAASSKDVAAPPETPGDIEKPVAVETAGVVTEVMQGNPGPAGQETGQKKEDSPALSKATEITDISFDRGEGTVNVIIRGNGGMNPTVFTLKNRIVVDIPDVSLKAKIPSTVISPIKGVRAGRHDEKTRLVIDLKELKGFDVSSVKDTIVVAIQSTEAGAMAGRKEVPQEPQKPLVGEKKEAANQKAMSFPSGGEITEAKEPETLVEGKYSGKKISLDFQDADIVPIFRLLADISGQNIVVSPDVKGKLTMKLVNVPWDQALDIILKTFSLGKSSEGNIIRIAPLSVFAKENEDRAKTRDSEAKAEPLETRIFSISYADVTVVDKAIKDSKILTSRGSLSVDRRTSALVVNDIPEVFPRVETLLATLDKPIPQVMIEARIVEVNTSVASDLGIQWGVKVSPVNGLSSLGGLSTLNKGSFTGNPLLVDFPSTSAGAGAGSGISFGMINASNTLGLDVQLSALETLSKGRIISNPRVVTTDNEKATIMQGESDPYPQQTSEGTISTAFKDIVLSTEVTPHITPAGSIGMAVHVKKEDVTGHVTIAGSLVPVTSKIESETKVIVQNGETLVIGGIYKRTDNYSNSGTPGLMDIPVLGELFKQRANSVVTSELLIFITPRIVEAQ
ncbi:MAG: type IV pilus secretin PilQ [Thermodesulfovibrionales bacterium]|jgi:type IV pilus secretin PilQ/predicted competence protein